MIDVMYKVISLINNCLPPKTLQWDYAKGPRVVLGGGGLRRRSWETVWGDGRGRRGLGCAASKRRGDDSKLLVAFT